MNTPIQLLAAAGAGFYRYWHVPHPHDVLDTRDTRRADLSLIGPGALALAAVASWATGRIGTTLLLDRRVTAPLESLPLGGRTLVVAGLAGVALAAAWWVCTARVRSRVARGVAAGCVARIPDNPDDSSAHLHTAVTHLGKALRDLPEPTPLADPAFQVLRTAVAALDDEIDTGPDDQRRLRRRCIAMANRLARSEAHVDWSPRPCRDAA